MARSRHFRRHVRARPGHPRLACDATIKTWMPGTSPGMTKEKGPGKTGAFFASIRAERSARIEFDDQMRLHLHRERHVRQRGDAGELRRHLAVIDLEEVGHVALGEPAR